MSSFVFFTTLLILSWPGVLAVMMKRAGWPVHISVPIPNCFEALTNRSSIAAYSRSTDQSKINSSNIFTQLIEPDKDKKIPRVWQTAEHGVFSDIKLKASYAYSVTAFNATQ